MSRGTAFQIIAVVLCLAASWISYHLLAKHVTGASGSAWFDAGCVEGEAGDPSGCETVLASPHAYWPPKKEGEPPRTPHIPVAFLGLVYFTSLAVWLIGVGRPSRSRRWVHVVPLVYVAAGLLVSARYMLVMYNVIEEWCPWCLTTHIMNVGVAICIVLLWPRRSPELVAAPASSKDGVDGEPASSVPVMPHPSWRCILGTIGVIIIVTYGNYGQSGLLKVHKTSFTLQQCLAAVARIKSDTAKLVRNWSRAEKLAITIRQDDPVRLLAQAEEPLPMVVFSDFKCPSCKRFELFLEKTIQPMFGGRIRVVFKHYPLDQTCNPQTSRTMHPHACMGAKITEAARLLGGNDAFWRAHDLLFELQSSQSKLEPYDLPTIAQRLGLDEAQLRSQMKSAQISGRIADDAALAKSIGVRGTPAIFVNGKRVDTLAATEPDFWNALAESYWREIKMPRPDATRPK